MSKEATEEVQHEAGQLVRHRGYFDREIFYNPINKYCVFSVRTDDQTVPKGCRSTYRYHDHMISNGKTARPSLYTMTFCRIALCSRSA